ncbi:MAG: YmdB family metallophosphoesterase [Synergistaceae bacterium]|jgi:metallophosphoesterase (TIGR00282 family)|nr:YmdB family metallophosphoesterase [Synergistaceae bacterium]
MRVLFVGDVVGRPGRAALAAALPNLARRFDGFDFVVANCENAAGGKGMTGNVMRAMFASGVHAMTSGNHIWDKNIFYPDLDAEPRVLRPANYPPSCPGSGSVLLERNARGSEMPLRLWVLNLQGRVFMPPIDCPFKAAESFLSLNLSRLQDDSTPVLIDFHAEATSEKLALAFYLKGGQTSPRGQTSPNRVSALVGTHTHVQTADERVFPEGMAYITDVGMTGGHGGVIGVSPEVVIPRYLTGMPAKFDVCASEPRINAVVIEIDESTGRAVGIERVNEPVDCEIP